MKSRRSWLIGLALGAALFFGTPRAQAQITFGGVPNGFSYQGLVTSNGQPIANGTHTFEYFIFNGGTQVYHQAAHPVTTTDGIFNDVIGGAGVFNNVPGITFNAQYSLVVVVDGTNTLPTTPIWAAPYALNAGAVNGIMAATTPTSGQLFPVPLATDSYTGTAKINPNFLPTIPNSNLATPDITTINGKGPDNNGNFVINADPTSPITVTTTGNTVTIGSSGGGAVTSVSSGDGIIIASPTTGNVKLSLKPGSLSAADFGPNSITGQNITGIAGNGLSQSGTNGNLLNVNVDNSTIGITGFNNGNFLEVLPGGIGTLQLANGAVTNAKIANPWINFTSSGSSLVPSATGPNPTTQLGQTENYDLNLSHTNIWAVNQIFHGVSDTGTVFNSGPLTEVGASTLTGSLSQSGGNVGLLTGAISGNTFTVGASGGSNLSTFYGPLTQQGGIVNINANSNFATNINTGNSSGNVTIGNNTGNQTNGVTIMAGTGTGTTGIVLQGATNINTTSLGSGLNPTSIGNSANPITTNATTGSSTFGTTFTETAGTSNSWTAPTNTLTANGSGGNNINGITNVNVSLNNNTNINTGTSSGTVAIGNSLSTTNVLGATNINTGTSATNTTIGNISAGTTVINGTTQINANGGNSSTTIGTGSGNALTVNATTTDNGPVILNNNITQNAGFTAQFDNTQINNNLNAAGTLKSNTAGDIFTAGSSGSGTTTVSIDNNGAGNALTVATGLSTFGTLGTDGQKLVINGLTAGSGGPAYELVVNGDASITGNTNIGGNLTVGGTITAASLGAPIGKFDVLQPYTLGNTVIQYQAGLFQTTATGNTFTGAIAANGGVTTSAGNLSLSSATGTVAVALNETVGNSLTTTGTTTLATNGAGTSTGGALTTTGNINDNGGFLGIKNGNFTGTQGYAQTGLTGSVPLTANRQYDWPDKSGVVAMLSDIAQIAPGTQTGQTLWWTGNPPPTGYPANSWQPTSKWQVRDDGGGQVTDVANSTAFNGTGVQFSTSTAVNDFGTTSVGTATSEGGASPPNTILTVHGVRTTTWSWPGQSPAPPWPVITQAYPTLTAFLNFSPITQGQYEQIIEGDLEVEQTLYANTTMAGLLAGPNLDFNVAHPFTNGVTMEFNGNITGNNALPGTPAGIAGTPVITVDNIPVGSFGEQVTAPPATAVAGGIQVTGAGFGTGVVIDPFPIGEDISATNAGLVIGDVQPHVQIGAAVPGLVNPTTPTLGINVAAVTTGMSINMVSASLPGTDENGVAGTTGLMIGNGPQGASSTNPQIAMTAYGLNSAANAAPQTTGAAASITNLGAAAAGNTATGLMVTNTGGGAGTDVGVGVVLGTATTSVGESINTVANGGSPAAGTTGLMIGNGQVTNTTNPQTAITATGVNTAGSAATIANAGVATGTNTATGLTVNSTQTGGTGTNVGAAIVAGGNATNTGETINMTSNAAANTTGLAIGSSADATNPLLAINAWATNAASTGSMITNDGNPAAAKTATGLTVNANGTGAGTDVGLAVTAGNGTTTATGETINMATQASGTGLMIGNAPTNSTDPQIAITATGSNTNATAASSGAASITNIGTPAAATTATGLIVNANGTGAGADVGLTVTSTNAGTGSGTGATIDAKTTGVAIGSVTAPTTGETVVAGTTGETINMTTNATAGTTGLTIGNGATNTTNPQVAITGTGVNANGSVNASGAANISNRGQTALNQYSTGLWLTSVGVPGAAPANAENVGLALNVTGNNAAAPIAPLTSQNIDILGTNSNWWITSGGAAVFSVSMFSPDIHFNTAEAYTSGNSMVFGGTGNSNPVITIGSIANPVGSTQYAEQINVPTNAAGGIQITGTSLPSAANGINMQTMGASTGVNYAGTTGTGGNFVLSGAGLGVSARVNGASAYTGAAGSAAIVGLQNSNGTLPSAGVIGLNGVTTTSVDGAGAGVVGETNFSNDAGVVGTNSTSGTQGIGVIGLSQTATTSRAGVAGFYSSGATTSNYGVLGTTTNNFPTTSIVNAAVLGFSGNANTPGVAADNEAVGGTGLLALANGGGNVTGVSVKTTGAAGFTGSVPNSTGIAVDVTAGSTTGLYIKGAGGASSYVPSTGTGIYVDPVTEGIVAVASTTGAEFMPQTNGSGTGLNLGTATGPFGWAVGETIVAATTGETINMTTAGSGTGLSIGQTTAPQIAIQGAGSNQTNSFLTDYAANVSNTATATAGDEATSMLLQSTSVSAVTGTNVGLQLNVSGANTNAPANNLDIRGTNGSWSVDNVGDGTFASLGAPNIRFNNAQAFTSPGTMTLDGTRSGANKSVAAIDNVSTGSAYGLSITGPTATTSGGGIDIEAGAVGVGTGLVVGLGPTAPLAPQVAIAATGTNSGPGTGGAAFITNSATSNGGAGSFATALALQSSTATGTGTDAGLVISTTAGATNNTGAIISTSGATGINTGTSTTVGGNSTSNIGSQTTITGTTTGSTVNSVTNVGNVGENITVSGSVAGSNIGSMIRASGNGSIGLDILGGGSGTPATGIVVDASSTTMGNGVAITNLSTGANGLAVTLNTNNPNNTSSINLNMADGTGGSNKGLRIQNVTNVTDHGIDIGMTNGEGIDFSTTSGGIGINWDALGSTTGISITGATGTGTAVLITAAGTNTSTTGISVGGTNGTGGYSSTNGSAVNVTAGEVRNSTTVQPSNATASNQFAGRVVYNPTGAAQVVDGVSFPSNAPGGVMTIQNNLAQGDLAGAPGTGSSVMVTYDAIGASPVTYMTMVQSVTNGSFTITCSSPVVGYINYIIINH